jgi:type II secretory ATPase GspE/PulE/Tfp pilus assembly ATPase PilB-like protein
MSQQAARDLLGKNLCVTERLAPVSFENEVLTVGCINGELEPRIKVLIEQRSSGSTVKPVAMPSAWIQEDASLWPADTANSPHDFEAALREALDTTSEEIFLNPNPLYDTELGGSLDIVTAGIRRKFRDLSTEIYDNVRHTLTADACGRDLVTRHQRGRLSQVVDGRHVFMRVITSPMNVITSKDTTQMHFRILRPYYLLPNLSRFGFTDSQLETILTHISRAGTNTAIVAPPGNGKTSFAYRIITNFNLPELRGFSIEYPTEIIIPDLSQVRLRPEFEYGLAEATEDILGKSPSFVFFGEALNDEGMGFIARCMSSGIPTIFTGHTEDAAMVPYRCVRLGADVDAAASLTLLIAIRLVPVLCEHCKRDMSPSKTMLQVLAAFPKYSGGSYFRRGNRPCDHCRGTGASGRTGVGEVFVVDEHAQRLIRRSAWNELRTYLHTQESPTMIEHALERYANGLLDEKDFLANLPITRVIDPSYNEMTHERAARALDNVSTIRPLAEGGYKA